MKTLSSLSQEDLQDKRVLMRVDFNVPIFEGKISDDTRMQAALEDIFFILDKGAALILCSHLGRPSGQGFEEEFSLKPVAEHLASLVGAPVHYVGDIIGEDAQAAAGQLHAGEILLLENLRFDPGEKKNDEDFARALAALADVYVNDAFAVSHRAHASVCKVTDFIDSYAGFLLEKEVITLQKMLSEVEKPYVAVLGGSKVSDKVGVISSLMKTCDAILIGGAMCFTFMKALGYETGKSLVEEEWLDKSLQMLDDAKSFGCKIILPVDFIYAEAFEKDAKPYISEDQAIPANMMGLDIGPKSSELFADVLAQAQTIFWNGPMGVFEFESFAEGTRAVAQAIANNKDAYSVIGGGDSVAAISLFDLADQYSFVSTGGGASMQLIEGKVLPGVQAIQE
ncbi:MAG: phosphoglycerate kinase [Coriobacteriia bacterium]|nr:phosphoglycerate kinase [Coriobacteriia bacterium]